MLSPIAHISLSFPTNIISPPPKWLDSDDDLEHEPALTSDGAFTVFSSSCSRAPSLAPPDTEDARVDIVSPPIQGAFIRTSAPPWAPLSRYNKSYLPITMSSTTREDVAAALLALHAQPRLGSSRPPLVELSLQTENLDPPYARRSRVIYPSIRNLVLARTSSPPPRRCLEMTPVIDRGVVHRTTFRHRELHLGAVPRLLHHYLHLLRLQRKMSMRPKKHRDSIPCQTSVFRYAHKFSVLGFPFLFYLAFN